MRDESEEEYLSDEDRFISVPPSSATKPASNTPHAVMNISSFDGPKFSVDNDSKLKDKENNNETQTITGKNSTGLSEGSLTIIKYHEKTDEDLEVHASTCTEADDNDKKAEQGYTENGTGETRTISRTTLLSNTTETLGKLEHIKVTDYKVKSGSALLKTADNLETSQLNDSEIRKDTTRHGLPGNQAEISQNDKEKEIQAKNELDAISSRSSKEAIIICENTVNSLKDKKDREESGNQLLSSSGEEKSSKITESENDENSVSSESDEQNCLGKAESRSQTSTEHWTELEVDEDVIDKIIIHTPGNNEPTLNLEVISQISQRQKSIEKEFSDNQNVSRNTTQTNTSDEGQETEDDSIVSSHGDRNSSSESTDTTDIKSKKDLKRTKKKIRKYVRGEIQREDTSENDSYSQQNTDVNTDNKAQANQSTQDYNGSDKSVSKTRGKSAEETDIEETGGETENSDIIETEGVTSEEDSDSIQSLSDSELGKPSDSDDDTRKSLSQEKLHVNSLQKSDSGYSENKVVSSANTQAKTPVKKNTIQSTQDSKSVSSIKSTRSTTSAISEKILSEHKTKLSNGKPSHQIPEQKKVTSEKVAKAQYDKMTKLKRLEHIENMKKIYKQKVTLKDNNKKDKYAKSSNSLPNISSPRKSPSYSITKVNVYDTQSDKRNSSKSASVPYISNKGTGKIPKSVNNHIIASKVSKEDTLLGKRNNALRQTNTTENAVRISYQRLHLGDNIKDTCNTPTTVQKDKKQTQTFHQVAQKAIADHSCHKHGKRHHLKEKGVKDINSFHNEIKALCVKSLSKEEKELDTSARNTVDRRLEITMNEMIALHGSSLDTNDGDFGLTKSDFTPQSGQPALSDPPLHVTKALIVDMPIQKVPDHNHVQSRTPETDACTTKPLSKDEVEQSNNTSVNRKVKEGTELNKGSQKAFENKKDSKDHDEGQKMENFSTDELDKALQEKRSRLRASKTYENIYKYKLSESHVTVSKGRESEGVSADSMVEITDKTAVNGKDIEATIALQDEAKDDIHVSTGEQNLDSRDKVFNHSEGRCEVEGLKKRCTTTDDEGNEVLCCILQALSDKVDPFSFTCEVVDPLDVAPITKRHELLISHVIKLCTYNTGHVAKERGIVAKIPIAHFFVEPWQELVIREVDKSGHWVETGEDVEIVQIPDMGKVVYGVQIALKELTYVAVVTRPRIITVTLEHRDRIITSQSDAHVKLRVPGTSDPRHVSLQSIPITEKVIKEFENTRGTDISSYITAASPLVILSLEGPNPESFSFSVPFTNVNYIEENTKDGEATITKQKESNMNDESQENAQALPKTSERNTDGIEAQTEPVITLNIPPRIRKRMNLEVQAKNSKRNHQKRKVPASKMLELEAKVHKREKERYLIQLGEGSDRYFQIKLLDDTDKIRSMDIDNDTVEVVRFSVYDTYARLFAIEFRDIVNFQEIRAAVKNLADYMLKHRVQINISQDRDNPFSIRFTASVDQPFRQRWSQGKHLESLQEDQEGVKFLEMNEGDAIGLAFRGNIEVTNQTQRVFSFHGYRGINANFDIAVRDIFSQKSLPEFHGAIQLYLPKRPRMRSISKNRLQNVSTEWDLITEYHFMLPKYLKKTPVIINKAPISLRFQEPLTADFVRQICKELIKDWDTFAFALGISNARIQAIKQLNRNQISERVLMDIIVCWMKQQPIARDKVGPLLTALRMCRKTHLENELKQRHKALKDTRTKTARDKHLQRAALALCQSRLVTVRWRQLFGYLLHLDTDNIRISEITSEIEEKYKNDATKCYHAIQYWNTVSAAPSIWKIIDALRHCNCPIAANTLRFQEYKRLF